MRQEEDGATRLVAWLARHRALVMLAWLAVALAAGSGALRLGFDQDSRVYFASDNPERLALEALERRHGRFAAAILMLAPRDGTVFSPVALRAIAEATARASAIADVAAVRSLSNLEAAEFSSTGMPAPLLSPGEEADEAHAERARSYWRADPQALVPLVSAAGDVAGIAVLLPTGEARHLAAAEEVRALKGRLAAANPQIEYRLSGDAVMDLAFLDAILEDIIRLAPLQGLLLVALILIMLQCLWSTATLLIVLAVAVAATMGAAGWAGLDLNGVTSATPMILLGLAVAACIHMLMAWQQALRESGDKAAAMAETIRLNAFPVFLAVFSTVASFLCLNFSDSPPFRQLGNLIAFGLSVTFLLAFTLLPVLVLSGPAKAAPGRAGMEAAMAALGRLVVRARFALLAGLVLIVAGSAWGITQLRFDDRFDHYFSERFEFRRDTDFMEKRLTGLTVLEFSLPAEAAGGIAAPAYLRAVDRFAGWLAAQPEAERVSSLAGILRRVVAFLPGTAGADGLPADEAAAREALATFNAVRRNPPEGRPVNGAGTHSVVSVTLSQVSSRQIRDFAARSEAWLAENAPAVAAPATGMALLAAHLAERNTFGMAAGTVAALAMVSLVLLVALRSLRLGIISLVPNLVPMLMAYGVWGALAGEVTFAATVVMAMTFGIVVDDTVHLLAKYNRFRMLGGLDARAAIPQSFGTVGVAVFATTAAIASGFFALSFSGFLVNRHLGLLTLLVLLSALACALLLLPPLLTLFDTRPAGSSRRGNSRRRGK